MVRDKGIVIRVEQVTKQNIEQAAQASGKTLSTFVIEAAEAAAAKVKKKGPSIKQFRGVPTFFRARCAEATRGGADGYGNAGYTLATHLHSMIPADIDSEEEWGNELDGLRESLKAEDANHVWNWIQTRFPRCIELIPARRKSQFLEGIYRAYEDERI